MRLNEVFIYGRVIEEPEIECFDLDRSKPRSAKILVKVSRKQGNSDNEFIRNDVIAIYSRNPEIISRDILMPKEIDEDMDVCKGDIIYVKGTLSTWMRNLTEYCPDCGEKIDNMRSSVYVDPLGIRICSRDIGAKRGDALIYRSWDMSNLAILGGWINTDPEYYENEENNFKLLEFAMSSKRIRRILEDGPEKRSDHPWIKVYGRRAEEYSKMFHYGSEVVIVGSLQAREHTVEVMCPHCMRTHVSTLTATELVPYRIEPVSNCDIPEKEDDNEAPDVTEVKVEEQKKESDRIAQAYIDYKNKEKASGKSDRSDDDGDDEDASGRSPKRDASGRNTYLDEDGDDYYEYYDDDETGDDGYDEEGDEEYYDFLDMDDSYFEEEKPKTKGRK